MLIVLAPREPPETAWRSVEAPRAIQSTPPWARNRLSSAAMTALQSAGEMSLRATQSSLLPAGSTRNSWITPPCRSMSTASERRCAAFTSEKEGSTGPEKKSPAASVQKKAAQPTKATARANFQPWSEKRLTGLFRLFRQNPPSPLSQMRGNRCSLDFAPRQGFTDSVAFGISPNISGA